MCSSRALKVNAWSEALCLMAAAKATPVSYTSESVSSPESDTSESRTRTNLNSKL